MYNLQFTSFSKGMIESQNVSATVFSVLPDNAWLQTKLFYGYLGSGAQVLAKFQHGLIESNIWSISVLIQDRAGSLVPPSYPTTLIATRHYSFYCNASFPHVVTPSASASSGLALSPYRVTIVYQN